VLQGVANADDVELTTKMINNRAGTEAVVAGKPVLEIWNARSRDLGVTASGGNVTIRSTAQAGPPKPVDDDGRTPRPRR